MPGHLGGWGSVSLWTPRHLGKQRPGGLGVQGPALGFWKRDSMARAEAGKTQPLESLLPPRAVAPRSLLLWGQLSSWAPSGSVTLQQAPARPVHRRGHPWWSSGASVLPGADQTRLKLRFCDSKPNSPWPAPVCGGHLLLVLCAKLQVLHPPPLSRSGISWAEPFADGSAPWAPEHRICP